MASKSKVKKSKRKKKQEVYEDNLFESDETFAFIAGYTAGGFPYGITWEEIFKSELKAWFEMHREGYVIDVYEEYLEEILLEFLQQKKRYRKKLIV